MQTPQEAKANHSRAIRLSARENYGEPGEADDRVNDSARAVIAAVIEANGGRAWIGNINLNTNSGTSPEEREAKIRNCLQEVKTGELVYNFGASFVIPCDDDEIRRIIRERHEEGRAPYSAATNAAQVDAIYDRVEELGGYFLMWT
ncbi:MAG: hypothetical protein AABY75_05540 [Bacteroidota bacterium]